MFLPVEGNCTEFEHFIDGIMRDSKSAFAMWRSLKLRFSLDEQRSLGNAQKLNFSAYPAVDVSGSFIVGKCFNGNSIGFEVIVLRQVEAGLSLFSVAVPHGKQQHHLVIWRSLTNFDCGVG